MYIKTEQGWKRLATICYNQIWEPMSWDPIGKEYIKDSLRGTLRLVRIEEIFDFDGAVNASREAPPLYRKKLPSEECLAFIAHLEAEHQEWLDRREALGLK